MSFFDHFIRLAQKCNAPKEFHSFSKMVKIIYWLIIKLIILQIATGLNVRMCQEPNNSPG